MVKKITIDGYRQIIRYFNRPIPNNIYKIKSEANYLLANRMCPVLYQNNETKNIDTDISFLRKDDFKYRVIRIAIHNRIHSKNNKNVALGTRKNYEPDINLKKLNYRKTRSVSPINFQSLSF